MIYIREAHPSNGRVSRQNIRNGIALKDPENKSERVYVAKKACSILGFSMPCLVDNMDDSTNIAYGAFPDRLYVIDKSGKIAVAGGKGPFGFSPSLEEANSWLRANIKN